MSQMTAEQLAQRIFDVGLLGNKEIDTVLQVAGGRGRATFDSFVMALLEQEALTNWQISRVVEGHPHGYFYGNWAILYLIGHGTFARVYRAYHRKTGDIKAVKVLRQRYSTDLVQREQFLREARMVMKLRHPNIVPIHEVEEDKGRIYMVMDFVEGQNLREYVRAHQRLNHLIALKIVRDIAAGLAYAAQMNITHRDLKLSNVLLSTKGQAKLVDFGLATINDANDPDEKGGPRSIDYAGLERTTGVRRNDARSDIFFLGCMLYQMVSGVPPLYETKDRIKRLSAQRYQEVRSINQLVPDIPHRVAILISRMMDLDPEKRIQSAALVVQETEAVIQAIESGDLAKFDENLTDQQLQAHQHKLLEKEEGLNRTVLVIESNIKLQDTLREKLKSRGYRVLITADAQRGLDKFVDLEPEDTEWPVDAVIFGCVGLRRVGIQAFAEFARGAATGKIPAILLVTAELTKFVKPEWLSKNRSMVILPLKARQIREELRKLLNPQAQLDTGRETELTDTESPSTKSPVVSTSVEDADLEN
jgi:serine/threonine protein kinase